MPAPRIFISYARKDGESFAADLRARLTAIFGDEALWRDRDRLEGGIGWWAQITQALETVAFMVLVATPEAMQSPIVRKEWRYARQQGVCVYPVQVPGLCIDFDALPRWMRDSHFYSLDKEWETFVNYLKSPCTAPRVPFYGVPDLPKHFVPRPEVFEALKAQLLDAERDNPVAITTSLIGAGGFGKTTLAAALCHDEAVQTAFDEGVLWVTLGENPDLLAILNGLYRTLTDAPSTFETVHEAAARFADKLADNDILLVVDDIWNAAHARPFLHGGERCARLLTTRFLDIAVDAGAAQHDVDEMSTDQAVEMLLAGIEPPADRTPFHRLAQRLGEWPLMLEIANGMLRQRIALKNTPDKAVDYVARVLEKRGVHGIQRENDAARKRSAEDVLSASFEMLSASDRERLYELAIFREDSDIPLPSMMALWGLDDLDSEALLTRFARFCFIRYHAEQGTIRIHDVVREVLEDKLTARLPRAEAHARLIDVYGDLAALPDAYAWRNIAYHLREAGKLDTLRALLLDHRFLGAKLDATDPSALIADYDTLPGDEAIRLLKSALSMSAHVVSEDKAQWGSQLVGRLMTWRRDLPEIHALTESIMEHAPGLYPINPDSDYAALNPAGGALVRTLAGHKSMVNHVAVTPDGRSAVSASSDHSLIVWDLETGAARYTLTGHMDTVRHVALTPDGRRAVSASHDKTLIVWDLETGAARHILAGHTDRVVHVAVTPDGQTAVSASRDESLIVWDLERGAAHQTLAGHTDEVNHVAITPDGRRAVSASRDKTLIVWDLATGTARQTLAGHRLQVNHVALTPDGRRAVSASGDTFYKGELIVWDLETGAARQTLVGHTDTVNHVAITPDGRRAVSASGDIFHKGELIVWDLETGAARQILVGHTEEVLHIAVTPDGRNAVSASRDKTFIVWDLETGAARHTLAGHTDTVVHVAVTPDGRSAVSASHDNTLIVWDLETGAARQSPAGPTRGVTHVAVTPDGRRAVSASDNRLIVWDLETGAARHTLAGHKGWVKHVDVTPDGRRAVSASDDNTLIVWNLETGAARQTLAGHKGWVEHVAVTPDGRSAVSASRDNTLIVWDLETGAARQTLAGHKGWVEHVAVTPDGRSAVSASRDNTLIVWDLETGAARHILAGHTRWVSHVALTPDGRRAVSASGDTFYKGELIVWDLTSGEQQMQVEDTSKGWQSLAAAYPGAWAFRGFRRTDDGWQLIYEDNTLLVQHPGGAAARWAGDGHITSPHLLAGGIIAAGDSGGHVLFLRWRGGKNQLDEGDR